MIDLITKAYVLKNFAGDAIDFVKERLDDMDVDLNTERWLHKVGLAPYKPTKRALGGLGAFVIGAAAGIVAGLAFATRPGDEFRRDIKDRARGLLGEAEMKADEIGRKAQAKIDQPRM
jgi:YtxH-like protein